MSSEKKVKKTKESLIQEQEVMIKSLNEEIERLADIVNKSESRYKYLNDKITELQNESSNIIAEKDNIIKMKDNIIDEKIEIIKDKDIEITSIGYNLSTIQDSWWYRFFSRY